MTVLPFRLSQVKPGSSIRDIKNDPSRLVSWPTTTGCFSCPALYTYTAVSGPARHTSASPDSRAVMALSLPPEVVMFTCKPSSSKKPRFSATYWGA